MSVKHSSKFSNCTFLCLSFFSFLIKRFAYTLVRSKHKKNTWSWLRNTLWFGFKYQFWSPQTLAGTLHLLWLPFSILCCDSAVLMVWLGLGAKKHLLGVSTRSHFDLNTLFSHHRHGYRCPGFSSKI